MARSGTRPINGRKNSRRAQTPNTCRLSITRCCGKGTVDEILEDCPQVDALVTSVGGGGLLAGLLTGLIRHQRMDCRIVACETQGAASFAAAIAAGHPVRLPRIDTVATSLGAAQVAAWPVQHILDFPHECVVLSDDEAIMG